MNLASCLTGRVRPGLWAGLLVLFCLTAFTPPLGRAAEPRAASAEERAAPTCRPPAVPCPPVVYGLSLRGLPSLEYLLGDRRRMLQFGAIGMCIALYFIIWRK